MSQQSAHLLPGPLPLPKAELPYPNFTRQAVSQRATLLNKEAKTKCTFSVVSQRSEFDALEEDWIDLMDRAAAKPHVFQNFHWLWHWCNHFLAENKTGTTLAIITGRRNGQLILVWPLVVQRIGVLKRVTWMGHPVGQYGDALIDPNACNTEDLRASWEFLSKATSADVIHLRKVRADASIARLMETICKSPLEQQKAPYLNLSDAQSFDDYQVRYSGKARKNRRRLRRRVEEQDTLHVNTYVDGTVRASLVNQAVKMKRTWLKSRGLVSPAIQDERTRAFFIDAASSTAHPTGCRTTALKIGNRTAAIEVSFVTGEYCAVHIIVYHMDFEKAGVGVLLMEDGIKSAIASGIKKFDLLAPGDTYKLDWADGTTDVFDWCAPISPLGRAYHALGLNRIPSALKTTLQTLPLPMRQALHHGLSRTH